MLFKKSVTMMLMAFGLAACTNSPVEDIKGNHLVGSELKTVSGVNKTDGTENINIAIFDESTRRIRQFNLDQMIHKKSYSVVNPGEKHSLLFEDSGSYLLDFSLKNITIYDKQGGQTEAPIRLQGTPIAAAFRPELGLIAIQDDMNSIGMMRLSPEGTVLKFWTGGSLVGGSVSISAGDMLENGNLILAMSDKSLRIVDVVQSIDTKSWITVGTPITTNFSNIVWVAPVRGSSNLVLLRTNTSIELFDLNTKTSISSSSLTGLIVEKYSKNPDPHLILRNSGEGSSEVRIAYVKNSQIQVQTVFKKEEFRTLSSYLNLQDDSWSYVEAKPKSYSVYNDYNATREYRRLRKYRISDMLALQNKELPNTAQLEISANYVFALFPSELGWAIRYTIDSDQQKDLKLFNAQDLK